MSLSLRVFRAARTTPTASMFARSLSSSSAAPAAPAPAAAEPNTEPLPSVEELRSKAKRVYKELHRLGREYPDTDYNFNMRLRRAFEKNASITDPAKLKQQLDLAEHIKKEILSMYSLKKYRHLRRAYHATEAPRDLGDHFAQVDHAAATTTSR